MLIAGADEALIRYIMLVRMLRMLRIFGGVDRFAIVFQVRWQRSLPSHLNTIKLC